MIESRHRSALVTGASRGIGRAIAVALAGAGYQLTISGRDEARLAAARHDLARRGSDVRMVAGDVCDDALIAELAGSGVPAPLHVLVLAAGVGYAAPFDSGTDRQWDRQFAVNVRAPFRLVRALLPALRAGAADRPERGAKIIAISSITGVAAEPDLVAYGATKSALASLCESLTVSECANGVTATAISPGYVDTDMSAWKHGEIAADEMIRATDVAAVAMAVCGLSRYATIPQVVVTRPGPHLWRA